MRPRGGPRGWRQHLPDGQQICPLPNRYSASPVTAMTSENILSGTHVLL